MHPTVNYYRFVLYKKPQEKRAIGREIAIFRIVWKMAVFRKMTKHLTVHKIRRKKENGFQSLSCLLSILSCAANGFQFIMKSYDASLAVILAVAFEYERSPISYFFLSLFP